MFGPFGLFGARFDWPEFVLGILAGLALSVLVIRIRPLMQGAIKVGQRETRKVSDSFVAGAKDRYHEELLALVETRHVARAIFALREIIIPPKLLAPPAGIDPEQSDPVAQDSLSVLPNLPDWNFLSGVYQSGTLSLDEALASGADLLLTGDLGTGKTTALAFLAAQLAQRRIKHGGQDHPLPVFIHAADLVFERGFEKDPLRTLVGAAQRNASAGLSSRLSGYLKPYFDQGHLLLLIDGLDEFPPEAMTDILTWIQAVKDQSPGLQMVAAGPVRGYGGLTQAGFAPLAMAPWNDHDQRRFLSRWGEAWQTFVGPNLPKNRLDDVDPVLITGWLQGASHGWTPLELTLRTWAAFAGDSRGANRADGFETYLARFLSSDEVQAAASAALAWITDREGAVTEKSLRRGTPVSDLEQAGLFIRRPGGRVSFFQPGIGAYLAAKAMAEFEQAPPIDDWAPVQAAAAYFAGLVASDEAAQALLSENDDDLALGVLTVGHWLTYADGNAAWRQPTLRALGKLIQGHTRPYGLRLRATHAMAAAQEDTAAVFFERLLSSEHVSSRILGGLGLGGLRHAESIEKLQKVINGDPDTRARQASCLALAAIGTDNALEVLGHALLEGDEPVRVAAAEALAINPGEGYAMLKEAAGIDNLLTRRAAVFGLARIPETWAAEQLEKIQVEDGQWVVRGAAAEALEKRRSPAAKVTPPPTELAQVPWLVAYASRVGLGIAPGRPALEMLRRAYTDGTHQEKAAALETMGWIGDEQLRLELVRALKGDDSHLRDVAYEALWRMEAPGMHIAPAALPEGSVPSA
ncbi:MAG: HEAT repeat domain-containing protein [Anaerolineales bacterium]|jgi:HEAT repeat protein